MGRKLKLKGKGIGKRERDKTIRRIILEILELLVINAEDIICYVVFL